MSNQIHPTAAELNAFSLGELSGDRADQVDRHVSQCDPCCETLAGLSSEDTFLSLLKGARGKLDEPGVTLDHQRAAIGDDPSESYRTLLEHPRYQIIEMIGRGGMGCVYRARHRVMDRTVALKVIDPQWVRRREAVDRFQREVQAAASLDHPNIVTAFDAEQADDVHFLVMEYVDGIDLAKKVKQEGPLDVAVACDYVRQVAHGLQYAHSCGMVHRDIKPHNLMVDREHVVKVLDFGLASLAPPSSSESLGDDHDAGLTAVGTVMGTPDFISPEQIRGAYRVDGRSDLYSLGMTLYFLLAARPPFADATIEEKLQLQAESQPQSLAELRDGVPPKLLEVVTRLTAKDPDDRFQTPAELITALSEFAPTSAVALSRATTAPAALTSSTQPRRESKRRVRLGRCLVAVGFIVVGVLLATGLISNGSVGRKLSRLKAPVQSAVSQAGDQVTMVLYSIPPQSIGAERSVVVCDVGKSRLAFLGLEFPTSGKEFLETSEVKIRDSETEDRTVIAKDGKPLFESQYREGVAHCRLLDADFTVNDQWISFGNNSFRWNEMDSHGSLIVIDVQSGAVRSQAMKPRDERVLLAGMTERTAKRRANAKRNPTPEMLSGIFEGDPELRQQVADTLLEVGETEAAIEVMASVKELDPKAVAWTKLAKKFEQSKESENAADAWLKAYKLDVRVLSREQIALFKSVNQIEELATLLTEERLKQLPLYNDSVHVLRAVLETPDAREAGYELMKRIWLVSEIHRFELLYNLPDGVWENAPDKAFFLETTFIPKDIETVGAGWEYLTISSYIDISGEAIGTLSKLAELLKDETTLRSLLTEVEPLVERHPSWTAGVAFLSVLKAYEGKLEESAELLQTFVADPEDDSIPSNSAWLIADVLVDKGVALNRVAEKLYQRALATRDQSLPLRNSPIVPLAMMVAKKGMKSKARDLLYRLADQQYEPDSEIVCSDGRVPQNADRCTDCHRGDRNLFDVMLMADKLSDIDYPVDAWLSLARIDASFGHVFSSEDKWTKSQFPVDLVAQVSDFQDYFKVVREKASDSITTKKVIDALDNGALAKQLRDREPMIADPNAPDFPRIELMLSVRGEGGEPSLFSPVIDLLSRMAKTATSEELDRLDWQLTKVPPGHVKSLDEIIAVTVFSYKRNRLGEAKLRSEQLLDYLPTRPQSGRDVGLWLVAKEALEYQETQALGERLAERARKAAESLDEIPVASLR